jgi:carboxymethylenebutenolidase
MSEQNIEFASNGDKATGFLAKPDTAGAKPGIVVIQEWWGINDHIKDIVKRFTEQGYIALAPDLYHGKIAIEPNDAQKTAMELDRPRAVREIEAAVEYLKAQNDVEPKKIAMIGFCMGGGLALHVAANNQDVGAVAAFYGGGAPEGPEFANATAAMLLICGEKDAWVTGSMRKLEEDFKQFAFAHELVVYPDAEHAFFNDTRKEVYRPEASRDAWHRALNWFKTHLA